MSASTNSLVNLRKGASLKNSPLVSPVNDRMPKQFRRNNMSKLQQILGQTSSTNSIFTASQPENKVENGSFECTANEGEHILAFNLRAAKHKQINGGQIVSSTEGFREQTWLTCTAGSVMSGQFGTFMKTKLLVSSFLYKEGRYIAPPAYRELSDGSYGLHPEASPTGIASMVYGIFVRDTKEGISLLQAELDLIKAKAEEVKMLQGNIDAVENFLLTQEFPEGVTEADCEEALIEMKSNKTSIEDYLESQADRLEFLLSKVEELNAQLSNKQFWRQLANNIQVSLNLNTIPCEDLPDYWRELQESGNKGLILKVKVVLSYDYLGTFELKATALDAVVEPGNLGGAVTGTVVTQKTSTQLITEGVKHFEQISAQSPADKALGRLNAYMQTANKGDKATQARRDYSEFVKQTRGSSDKPKWTAAEKREHAARKRLEEKLREQSEKQTSPVEPPTKEEIEEKLNQESILAATVEPPTEVEEEYDPDFSYSGEEDV